VATHFYSSCNQHDTDAQLLATIPGFATDVRYIRSQLATNPVLASVPVWITENNVNADYAVGNNMSNCNPGQRFVDDTRIERVLRGLASADVFAGRKGGRAGALSLGLSL